MKKQILPGAAVERPISATEYTAIVGGFHAATRATPATPFKEGMTVIEFPEGISVEGRQHTVNRPTLVGDLTSVEPGFTVLATVAAMYDEAIHPEGDIVDIAETTDVAVVVSELATLYAEAKASAFFGNARHVSTLAAKTVGWPYAAANEATDYFYHLGEAIEAMRTGGDWTEPMLNGPDFGNEFAVKDSSPEPDAWYLQWRGVVFEVEAGEIVINQFTCDTDGDWDFIETDPADLSLAREETGYEAAADSMQRYYAYVAESGSDPIGLISRPASTSATYDVRLQDGDGMVLALTATNTEVHGRTLYPIDFPDSLRRFLNLQDGAIEPATFKSLDDVRDLDGGPDSNFTIVKDDPFTIRVTVKVPPSDQAVALHVSSIAKTHLS